MLLFVAVALPIAAYILINRYRDERSDPARRQPNSPTPSPDIDPNEEPEEPDRSFGDKSRVTWNMNVSAGFYARAQVWCFQDANCQHFGTDYTGPEGTPVYLPFDAVFLTSGNYLSGPTRGQYVMFRDSKGGELYFGHLKNIKSFTKGVEYKHGTKLGEMNDLLHTHVQLRINGRLSDFERYYNDW